MPKVATNSRKHEQKKSFLRLHLCLWSASDRKIYTKGKTWMQRERKKVRGFMDLGLFCSCTRESVQLGEKREMGYRCTVSNTDPCTSIDTLRCAPLLYPFPQTSKPSNILTFVATASPLYPPPPSYANIRGPALCFLCNSNLRSFCLMLLVLQTQQAPGLGLL